VVQKKFLFFPNYPRNILKIHFSIKKYTSLLKSKLLLLMSTFLIFPTKDFNTELFNIFNALFFYLDAILFLLQSSSLIYLSNCKNLSLNSGLNLLTVSTNALRTRSKNISYYTAILALSNSES
jgi:hypothetical protein